MRLCVVALMLFFSLAPAVRAEGADKAFDRAIEQFEAALPRLPANLYGVDAAAYRDALTLRTFSSSHWGGTVSLRVANGKASTEGCDRFAALVRLPPEAGRVTLVLCPQFYTDGADALRRLTVLHELVHVVAGPDECLAMAFAARVEFLATGHFTPVDRYWQANRCEGSGFSLP